MMEQQQQQQHGPQASRHSPTFPSGSSRSRLVRVHGGYRGQLLFWTVYGCRIVHRHRLSPLLGYWSVWAALGGGRGRHLSLVVGMFTANGMR